ncbi:MAG: replicative DNA helicase [Candidatus Pacebacteria bacterium]|nr:replicative DNA helicase [Candidatus Paceibacterota bacterium]
MTQSSAEIIDYNFTPQPDRRTAPHNENLEMALLAALMHNNRAFEYCIDFLKPDHFSNRFHAKIYEDMVRLINKGMIADPVTLQPFFLQYEWVKDKSVPENYLIKLATHLVAVINTAEYAKTIYDLYLRRALINYGTETVNQAFSHEIDPDGKAQLEAAEQKLFELASSGTIDGGPAKFSKGLTAMVTTASAAVMRPGGLAGVATGLTDLDRLLGGLAPSDLIIIAGRPSMGKTALATNIAYHIAAHSPDQNGEVGKNLVLFFSLEMSQEQLVTRVAAEQMNLSSEKIRRGDLTPHEFEAMIEVVAQLQDLPLYIDDTPALTVSALRTRSRRLARQNKTKLALIVVDYLQLLKGKGENRVQEISEITQGLKALAKELMVPVIALSQLSRAVEQREDKRPQLADLRDSGTIEQDADIVAFVYREEYYLEREEPAVDSEKHDKWQVQMERAHGKAEIIIAKQRHGPIGRIEVVFDGATTRFSDLDGDDNGFI